MLQPIHEVGEDVQAVHMNVDDAGEARDALAQLRVGIFRLGTGDGLSD
jgi:hypothetical protein